MIEPICTGCNQPPSELAEYIEFVKIEGCTPEKFVIEDEGTYNPENGHFLCTDCYIKAGMPSSPTGWKAP